jgi:nickel transport protein
MARFVLVWLIFAPAPALAHKMNLFAHVDDVVIAGRTYFPGDIAAREVDVIARDASGNELGRAKTDDSGNFTLTAPIKTDYHLTAEAADGHAASCVVSAQVDAMQGQSDQGLRIRDFLGGIGYILGLAGIGFYFRARRWKTTSTSQGQL